MILHGVGCGLSKGSDLVWSRWMFVEVEKLKLIFHLQSLLVVSWVIGVIGWSLRGVESTLGKYTQTHMHTFKKKHNTPTSTC